MRLARQAGQVPGDIPASIARARGVWLTEVLIQAGDFAAAERVCADGLAASPDAGDLVTLPTLLARTALLDLRAGRADDAAAHQARAAEERGAAMGWATAAEYALVLTGSGSQPPPPPGPGLGKLSGRERELVTLVAQGARNAQIAAQLSISVRMVAPGPDPGQDPLPTPRRPDRPSLQRRTCLAWTALTVLYTGLYTGRVRLRPAHGPSPFG